MRTIFLAGLLWVCILYSFAQDLIVTHEGDSLNCKITKTRNDMIYFTFKHKGEVRNTLLPIEQVKFHQKDFYQTSEVSKNQIIGNALYSQLRGAINGGWGYLTAPVGNNYSGEFNRYVKDLKSGYQIGADITYYFSEIMGVGAKYQLFKSSNRINNISSTIDGVYKTGSMSDNISATFVGPSFYTRLLNSDKKNALLLGLSFGYLGYKNNCVLIEPFTISGSTAGFVWDIGYDIGVSQKMAIGINLSMVSGYLSRINLSDEYSSQTVNLDKDSYINLSRIDLSVGLRFYTGK